MCARMGAAVDALDVISFFFDYVVATIPPLSPRTHRRPPLQYTTS